MAKVKFNCSFKGKKEGQIIEGTVCDITLKRADEMVNKLKGYKGYEDAAYKRVKDEE